MSNFTFTDLDKLDEMYKAGKRVEEIAETLGYAKGTVYSRIQSRIKLGILERREKVGYKRKPKTKAQTKKEIAHAKVEEKRRRRNTDTSGEVGGIRCTYEVSQRCVYGGYKNQPKDGCNCNYVLVEGHSRPGNKSGWHCLCFEERTKDNPRKKIPCEF